MMHVHRGPIKCFLQGIYDGPHATPPEATEGPVFLGIKNVTPDGRIDLSEIRHVSEQDFPKWTRRVLPQEHDIVFSYEATLHRYVLIPNGFRGCLGRRMALMRTNRTMVDPCFLHYYFLTPSWKAKVEAIVINGATVDRIPLTKFPELELILPTLPEQKRIASILNAYDHLIENSRRRIQLLEQSARLLYREWFVHLRFPGHEGVKIKDGVPEGWERKRLDQYVHILGGFPFKRKTYQDSGKFGIVTIKNVHDSRFNPECNTYIDDPPRKMKPHCHLLTGDILLSLTGNIGRTCIVIGDNFLLNQRVAKLVPFESMPKSYIYWSFNNTDMQRNLENLAYGVAQQNLSPVKLGEQEQILPSPQILRLFESHVEPFFNQICNLSILSRKLMKARDLLLPRLMNGKIAV
jgi:type I restriction enzyme S subunit